MPTEIYALPDNGPDTAGTATVPADGGRLQAAWDWALAYIDTVPAWSWALALAALTVFTLICLPMLRTQAFKAGARDSRKQLTAEDRKDRRLLIAALIPAVGFWIAVLVGSGRGLIAFGRDDLKWTGGWEYLVPLTLDGVAISFGLLAFRAVRKKRSPDRAVRIAAGAMVASSAINFLHEVGGSKLGASYLAILSLLGMLIFDELLAQFEEGSAYIKRQNPRFGLRWITWPTNTLCAWFAWRNYPPAADTDATIRAAVKHLETVRAGKAAKRAATVDAPAWWMRLAPWIRARQLETTLTVQRAETGRRQAYTANLTARLETALADLTAARADLTAMAAKVETVTAENTAVKTSLQDVTERAVKEREDLTAAHTADKEKALRDLSDRLTAQFTARLEELSTVSITKYRDTHPKTSPVKAKQSSPQAGNRPAVNDETAVQMMLTAHNDPGYTWSQNAVRTLTGAGFTRIPKLIELWFTAASERADGEPQAVNQ